jgi:ElaB/YqjD/DUF883 family membrane-anchored ribosome-binding protein
MSPGETASELRSDAQQIGNKAKDRIHSEVDARKGTAVEQAKSVSNAIQSAAGQLDEGAPQWLRSAFEQGAQQIQRFADSIEQKDSRQLVSDVQSFARERPALFLGAAAAVGFAAARIFKAGGEQQSGYSGQGSWDRSSDLGQSWGSGDAAIGGGESYGDSQSFGQSQSLGGASSSPMADDPLFEGSDSTTTGSSATGAGRGDFV